MIRKIPLVVLTLLPLPLSTTTAQENIPAAPPERSAIDRVASGELNSDLAEAPLFDELLDEEPATITRKLLEGALKAKSPADAIYLLDVLLWIRDELQSVAESDAVAPAVFDIDPATTNPLWKRLLEDTRTNGYTFSGKPYTVAHVAAATLESLVAQEEFELLAELQSWAGSKAVDFNLERSRARLAGEALPDYPDPSTLTDEERAKLMLEFLNTEEEKRQSWLFGRSIAEILALGDMALANEKMGEPLLKQANKVTAVAFNERGISRKSEWQPKERELTPALIDEVVDRAKQLSEEGKRCSIDIIRWGGFEGVEIVEFPLIEGSDTLNYELIEDSPLAKLVEFGEFYGLFCKGTVYGIVIGEGSSDVLEEATWLVGPKPEPPSLEKWEELVAEAEAEQAVLLQAARDAFADPRKAGSSITLTLWSLPTK